MDGGGTTTHSCFASSKKQSKAKSEITKCKKKITLGQKIKANRKIIMAHETYSSSPRSIKILASNMKIFICPKFVYKQEMQFGPLGVKTKVYIYGKV